MTDKIKNMAKNDYSGLVINLVETELQSNILTGSVTATSIKVQEVEVEEYHQGFGTDATNDFKEISFD